MAEPTFRDFAAAVMGRDQATAAAVLRELLGLSVEDAAAAAARFADRFAAEGPPFLGRAMGLRAALAGPDDALAGLLAELFGLAPAATAASVAALRRRYPA